VGGFSGGGGGFGDKFQINMMIMKINVKAF